jgi:membrane protein
MIGKYVREHPTAKKVIKSLDQIQLRKKQVSLYQILLNLFHNIRNDDILGRASSVAFSFTLAVFPAIIFLFSLIPYIPIPNLSENAQELFEEMAMFEQVRYTIEDIVSRPRGDLLSFSVLLSLFLASNAMMELAQTFNKIYKTVERRTYLRTRLTATILTVGLALVIFISVILLIAGQFVLDFLIKNDLLARDLLLYSIITLRFTVLFILFLVAISFIYFFGPALHNRWKFISIGSVVATLLALLVSYIFSFYISNFGTYNKIYGSIGAMIALMVWIYMISVILLIGFEVNASIDQAAEQASEEEAQES